MKLIKDLGYTDLEGHSARKRYYVIVECPYCLQQVTIRKERLTSTQVCKDCVKHLKAKQTTDKVNEKLQQGTLVCTKCNVEQPLTNYHKDSTKALGYRSVCKNCRVALEKEANILYSKSEAGKICNSISCSKRRTTIRNTDDNTINVESLKILKESQDSKCYYCGKILNHTIDRAVHLDHVIPLSRGGAHSINNVVWSCQKCNLQKHDKLLEK